jgi:hypothetical protein
LFKNLLACRWRRRWTAERNKHRQLLLSYCYLSGGVDSRALDVTMQAAIGAGCDSGSRQPYQQLIYNAMQVGRDVFVQGLNITVEHQRVEHQWDETRCMAMI